MAYEKYITRNGKVYGPYVYHSRRINGKVVSEYRGPNSKSKKVVKKNAIKVHERKKENFPPKRQLARLGEPIKLRLFAIIGIFVILLLVLGFFFLPSQLTGKSIVNFEGLVVSDKLVGSVYLKLNGGELIPADSKFIVSNENSTYEFLLRDLFKEQMIVGEFFLSNGQIEGVGEGFGLLGKKEEMPEVSFEILIEPESSSESHNKEPEDNNKTASEENTTKESSSTEELVNLTEGNPVVKKSVAGVVSEKSSPKAILESEEDAILETAPMTGNVVSTIFKGVGNFFSTILTGRVINSPTVIQGGVVKGEVFTYNLPAGATARIVNGSVKALDKDLSEDDLSISIQDGVLKITTDYSKIELGFGKEYLTNETRIFVTTSEDQGITLVEGSLNVLIEFNGSSLVSYSTNMAKKDILEVEKNKTVPEVAEEVFNKTNITIESDFDNIILTEKEKKVLRREFKLIVVNTTAIDYKNKVLVNFKLGNYFMSNSYDASLSTSKLKNLIEKDRIIWLKDLARELGGESTYSNVNNEFSSLSPVM